MKLIVSSPLFHIIDFRLIFHQISYKKKVCMKTPCIDNRNCVLYVVLLNTINSFTLRLRNNSFSYSLKYIYVYDFKFSLVNIF